MDIGCFTLWKTHSNVQFPQCKACMFLIYSLMEQDVTWCSWDEIGNVVCVFCYFLLSCLLYLPAWVSPGSELQITQLVVKGKPGDVYQTCRFENARRDVRARARRRDNNIGRVGSVKRFAGAERELNTQFRSCDDHPFADDHHPRGGLEGGAAFWVRGFSFSFFL